MLLSPEQSRVLLKALMTTKDPKQRASNYGICNNLRAEFDLAQNFDFDFRRRVPLWLRETWRKWENFSGDPVFPVPSSLIGLSAEQYFYYAERPRSTRSGGYWEGEYGKLRMNLLDFLISELKKEVGGKS